MIAVIGGNILTHYILKRIQLREAMSYFLIVQLSGIVLLSSTLIYKSFWWLTFCITIQEVVFGMTSLSICLYCYQHLAEEYPTYSYASYTSLVNVPRFLLSPISAWILSSQNWHVYFEMGIAFSILSIFLNVARFSIRTRPHALKT